MTRSRRSTLRYFARRVVGGVIVGVVSRGLWVISGNDDHDLLNMVFWMSVGWTASGLCFILIVIYGGVRNSRRERRGNDDDRSHR